MVRLRHHHLTFATPQRLNASTPQRRHPTAAASLILVIGPICGYTGAKRLNKNLNLVYLVFSLIKVRV